eukprot:gene11136-18756_t
MSSRVAWQLGLYIRSSKAAARQEQQSRSSKAGAGCLQ